MKKWLFILISVFCLGYLVCCARKQESALERWVVDDGRLRVLATTAIVQDLVERVGGEDIKVISIINGNLDPHSYEIVKGDGEKFQYAELVFSNGLMLEHSASMQYQLKHHKAVVALGDVLMAEMPEKMIYVEGQMDPHIWMDVSLWSQCIDPVVKALSQRDPEHAEGYRLRGEATREAFLAADRQILERMRAIPAEKRYLITSHDAFNYHVRRYLTPDGEDWHDRMKALQGLAPDEQINVLQVKELVDHITKYKIGVVFPESNLSRDSLEKVREGCGRAVVVSKDALYGDTLGGKDYLTMLEHNATVLEKNLNEH